jgi:PAS domain S-box-containing protein
MLYCDDDVQRIQDEILPTVEAEGYWRGETTGVRADGSTFVEDNTLALTDTGELVCTVRDITERKERVQQVERERDRFVAIFEAVPEPIVHVRFDNEQPIVKNINSAFTDTFGYDLTDIEGESINDAIVPDEHIDEARQIDASVQDRGTVEREVERVAADGRRPFLFRSNTFEVADDTMESIGVYIDLTEQKQREQQLEFERDRLESLFTAIPEPAVEVEFTDDGPLLRDVNEAFETTFGYDAAAVRGEDINDLIVPDDPEVRSEAEVIDERASAGEQLARKVQRETSDGRRDFLFRSAPIGHEQDSETPQQFGLYIDITERKERERALRHLQQRTQELMHTATNEETAQVAVEAAHDVVDVPLSGCHLVDDEQRRLEPTAAVDTVREELGDPPAYERTVDDAPAGEVVWQVFEHGEPLVIDDTREYGRLAEVTPARSAIIYPLDDYGVFIVSATEPNAFDDTDTTLTEIIATSLKTALERVDREQTLERQNDRLDEFAGIVSHDLRNPLGVVEARLQLAQEECDSDHLQKANDALARSQALIEDLLTLAREGTKVTDLEPVELTAVAEGCWNSVETDQATLEVDQLPVINADRSRVKQLFENLYRNAVEHGGTDVTVSVGVMADGFYVADTGPGIPESEREAVFEAGYSTNQDWTGFGLRIVEEVADAHGWEVAVTESAQGGARFEITGVESVN